MPLSRPQRELHLHVPSKQSVERLASPWQGLRTEIVVALQPPPFEYRYKLSHAMLMIAGCSACEGIVTHGDLPEAGASLPEPALLDRVLRQQPPSRGGLSGWQRNKVADFIEAHLSEALRLAMLAELAGLSPYHFARAFKQSFGLPPHRYHLSRRIVRAKTLLAEPQWSVTDIARTLGFAETSSFSAAFRKATGFSPREWRRAQAAP